MIGYAAPSVPNVNHCIVSLINAKETNTVPITLLVFITQCLLCIVTKHLRTFYVTH